MKTFRLLLPAALLLASCSGDPEPANQPAATDKPVAKEVTEGTPKAIAEQIAALVIANNNEGLLNLIITQEEMTDVIKGSSVTQMGKEVAIKNIPVEISKMRTDMTNGLADIRKQCETKGIDWAACRFKDVQYEMNNPTGYFMAQLKCTLDCNGMEYLFTVTDVVQAKNGWKLGGTMYSGDVPPQRTPVQ